MHNQRTMTQTIKISEVRGQFSALVNQVHRQGNRVVVEKSGVPVAGLVSAEDLKRLDQFDRERDADFAIVDEVRDAFRDVPDEEIERETDRILANVRAEMRAEREQTAAHS